MTKKIFAFIIGLVFIFATSSVFATNELKDSMDKTGSSISNIVNGAGSVIKDAGTAVKEGAQDIGNTVSNGVKDAGSALMNGAEKLTSDVTRTDTRSSANNGYTTTRTSTDAKIMGMSANTWTWFILAIAALAIVALVWYYAMQNQTEYNHHND